MGKRGPAPKPTRLKLLHGQRQESRLNRSAPKPTGGLTMPRGMSKAAQTVWRRVVKAMAASGILTSADADALRIYAEAMDRYTVAAELLAAAGPLVPGPRGHDVKNPLSQIVRDNANLAKVFGQALGLAPAAREGLHVADTDEDPLEAWIRETGRDT
jgi:P27 family predicted phage terminase small subunit